MDIKQCLPRYFCVKKEDGYDLFKADIIKEQTAFICRVTSIMKVPEFRLYKGNPPDLKEYATFIRKSYGQSNRPCLWKLDGDYLQINGLVIPVIQVFNCEERILPKNVSLQPTSALPGALRHDMILKVPYVLEEAKGGLRL